MKSSCLQNKHLYPLNQLSNPTLHFEHLESSYMILESTELEAQRFVCLSVCLFLIPER